VVGGASVTSIQDTPISEYEKIQSVDARGVFLCMKYQLKVMTKQDVPTRKRASRGVIVNIASRASLEGVPKFGAYCTAKHGVLGMSRVAAVGASLSGEPFTVER
jgi:NAD(P)-dependent dehydrogenase (short-subunit alcohol dehydrogenase family)